MEKKKCQICGRYTLAVRTCILCGKEVCPRCYRVAMGVCKECIPGQKKERYNVIRKYVG